MLDRPGPPVAIDEMATQEERPETLTGPTTIHHRRGPQPRQVPAAFLLAGRDPHRDELTRPEQTHQPSSVTTIGLDFVARSDRHQRRCDHLTVDTHRPKQPMQLIAGRAGLVTHPQPARPTQPGDQTTDRHLVMRDLLQPRCRLRRPVQHPTAIASFATSRPTHFTSPRDMLTTDTAGSSRPCGSAVSVMVDDPRIKPGREPAVPLQLCGSAGLAWSAQRTEIDEPLASR